MMAGNALSAGLQLPIGMCFSPTDEDLVTGRKLGVGGDVGDWHLFSDALVPTVDLYADGAQPWRVCRHLACPYGAGSTEFYCFTPRRKKYDGACIPDRTVGSGTWVASGHDHHIYHRGILVGYKSLLTFKLLPLSAGAVAESFKKFELVNTHWVMHEYRVDGDGFQEMVLCRIRNIKKEREEEKGQWSPPWWEEQEPGVLSGGVKKRKEAPQCDDAATLARKKRRGRKSRASSTGIQSSSPADAGCHEPTAVISTYPPPATAFPIYAPSAFLDVESQEFLFYLGAEHDNSLDEFMDYSSDAASTCATGRLLEDAQMGVVFPPSEDDGGVVLSAHIDGGELLRLPQGQLDDATEPAGGVADAPDALHIMRESKNEAAAPSEEAAGISTTGDSNIIDACGSHEGQCSTMTADYLLPGDGWDTMVFEHGRNAVSSSICI